MNCQVTKAKDEALSTFISCHPTRTTAKLQSDSIVENHEVAQAGRLADALCLHVWDLHGRVRVVMEDCARFGRKQKKIDSVRMY